MIKTLNSFARFFGKSRSGPNSRKRKAAVPAGRNTLLSKDKLCFIFLKPHLREYRRHYVPFPNSDMQFLRLPHSQRDAFPTLTQGEITRWHCAARREIAERSEEAPGAEAAQPSQNGGIWKALEG
ncbi:hypothetical protein KL86DES1_20752 [uncultured Desulfovibrio sp.]|uniref:Uncharacterized protein n=1 Tax=uncultured Desulfovibrio sp. TaxID=167968 RepID=A0A212L550_9BACT|nr:hypothetical protein KL86DES1_20752 [uncultured Desulfovibrio sp.]VZH33653.1 conserved protein of unknown function [Desulfovibrio sp. 86]